MARLVVFVGPMFSGKTSALLSEVSRAVSVAMCGAGGAPRGGAASAVVFTHALDHRADLTEGGGLSTHSPLFRQPPETLQVVRTARLLDCASAVVTANVVAVGIDEAQFFDADDLHAAVLWLLRRASLVVVSGLDGDAGQQPFPGSGIPSLLPLADAFTKLQTAACRRCVVENRGVRIAFATRLLSGGGAPPPGAAAIGGAEKYEAICRACLAML